MKVTKIDGISHKKFKNEGKLVKSTDNQGKNNEMKERLNKLKELNELNEKNNLNNFEKCFIDFYEDIKNKIEKNLILETDNVDIYF